MSGAGAGGPEGGAAARPGEAPEAGAPAGRVVAVDGPAASGKSTAARGVARRLGFGHVSSGLLYRAVTWAAVRGGWEAPGPEFRRRLEALELELVAGEDGYGVRVDGVDPGDGLTSEEVVDRVSEVAARPEVREKVNRRVRAEARRADLVCDGRDVGATVFPDADLKVYLVAAPRVRARRRLAEREAAVTPEAVRREARRLAGRDDHDASREVSPLRAAEDAVEIDTTDLAPDEVVDRIVREARERGIVDGG